MEGQVPTGLYTELTDEQVLVSRKRIFGFSSPLFFVVATIPFAPLLLLFRQSFVLSLTLTILAELLMIAVAFRYAWGGKGLAEAIGWREISRGELVFSVLAGLSLFGELQVVTAVVSELSGEPLRSSETSSQISAQTGPGAFLLLFVFVPFLIPLLEEVVFRGLVLNAFRQSAPGSQGWALIGIVFSSAFFALMHFQGLSSVSDMVLLAWIFLLAVVNCVLAIRFRSILAPFACHAAYNGATILLGVVLAG